MFFFEYAAKLKLISNKNLGIDPVQKTSGNEKKTGLKFRAFVPLKEDTTVPVGASREC